MRARSLRPISTCTAVIITVIKKKKKTFKTRFNDYDYDDDYYYYRLIITTIFSARARETVVIIFSYARSGITIYIIIIMIIIIYNISRIDFPRHRCRVCLAAGKTENSNTSVRTFRFCFFHRFEYPRKSSLRCKLDRYFRCLRFFFFFFISPSHILHCSCVYKNGI